MYSHLIIDENTVYEIDKEYLKQRQGGEGYGDKSRGTKSPFSPGEIDEAGK